MKKRGTNVNNGGRSRVISMRLAFTDHEQFEVIKAAAEKRGLSFSRFTREVSSAVARRLLGASRTDSIGDLMLDAPSMHEHPAQASPRR